MKKASIIVPVYNTEKYVQRCIESILNQSYTNFELILINDGSTDDSGKICENYAKKDDRIIFKSIENAGVSNARNVALEIVSGDYITFVDSDDVIRKDYLQEMINAITSTDSQIVFCDSPKCYDKDINDFLEYNQQIKDKKITLCDFDNNYDFTAELAYTSIPGTFYRKECILYLTFENNIFIGEDSLFIFRAIINSKKIAFLKEPLYGYYQRNDSATGTTPYNEKKFTEVKAWEIISAEAEEYGGKLLKSSKALVGIAGFKGIKHMKFYGGYDKEIWKYCVRKMRKEAKNVILSKVNRKIKIQYLLTVFFPNFFMSALKKIKCE